MVSTADGPLGILAGSGSLPLEVATSVLSGGRAVHVVGIADEADARIAEFPHSWVGIGQIGGMLRAFRDAGCRDLVILGAVSRPDLWALKPDSGFFLNLPSILALMAGGDDSILRRIVSFFQRRGFRVLGAHEVAPGLLAEAGVIGDGEPDQKHRRDIEVGLELIMALGPSDVGQAVVIAGGRPIAIEGAEGTDRMLARLAGQSGRRGEGGVLVKAPKPSQEVRIDLPAVGPKTVEMCTEAGLAGIAVASGQVLIAERARTKQLLAETGLFLFGVPQGDSERRTTPKHIRARLVTVSGRPAEQCLHDAERALVAMSSAQRFGAGGAAVSIRQHVLAVEAGEGPAAMLERVAGLRQWGDRASGRRRGIVALRSGAEDWDQVAQRAAAAGLAGIVIAQDWPDENRRALVSSARKRGLCVLAEGGKPRTDTGPLRVFLVAGEHSGDALGARLMAALKAKLGCEIAFSGVGGELMREQGLESLFPLSDVAVMGPLSILQRLPRIMRRVHQTVDAAIASTPDVVVIIDSPEFTHAIARRIRRRAPDVPIINYVSPSVWAWRPGRAAKMRKYVDHVLALLPFEPEAHRKLGGPPCTYVGHPLIERRGWLEALDPSPLAQRLGIAPDDPVLVLLPGSRSSEVGRLMQPFGGAVRVLCERGLAPPHIVIPAVPHVRGQIESAIADWPVRPHLIEGEEDKWRAFKLATAALAASGTVTLELALAGTPAVVAYKVDAIAAQLRFLVKVPSVVLANLVLGENVYPEFIQEDCSADKLASALAPLLGETPERHRQLELLARVPGRLATTAASPSDAAAEIVLDCAKRAG